MWLAIIGDCDYWSYPSGRSVRLYTDGCVVDSGMGLMGPCKILELLQNSTIEERVALLEFQVVVIQNDITVLDEDVIGLRVDHTQLEGDVNFLFDEQVIQDERLLILEQDSDAFDEEIESESLESRISNLKLWELFSYACSRTHCVIIARLHL